MTAWCEPDGCPASICNGPHVQHKCRGYTVTARAGQSCPMCEVAAALDNGHAMTPPEAFQNGSTTSGGEA